MTADRTFSETTHAVIEREIPPGNLAPGLDANLHASPDEVEEKETIP